MAAKYGKIEVANLLLQKNAPPDAAGKVRRVCVCRKDCLVQVNSVWAPAGIPRHSQLTLILSGSSHTNVLAAPVPLMHLCSVHHPLTSTVCVRVLCVQSGLTPLHVAAHYDNQKVALLLLNQGASPHAAAKVRSGQSASASIVA